MARAVATVTAVGAVFLESEAAHPASPHIEPVTKDTMSNLASEARKQYSKMDWAAIRDDGSHVTKPPYEQP